MIISYYLTIDTETGEADITPVTAAKDPLGLFLQPKGKTARNAVKTSPAPDIAAKREVGADFVMLWNKICVPAGLKKVVALSDKRAVHCYERAAEMSKALGLAAVEVFQVVCEKVVASKFLRGNAGANPKNGHAFICTFDWLTQYVGNWLKVYEGNYDDDKEINPLNVNELWQ